MRNGFRIGRIAGIDVHLDWSLLIVFFLIVFSLGGTLFPFWHSEWSSGQSWLTALAAALLFFVSVLLHELSHALVGRRYGVEVRRISLFVFGGVAKIVNEPGHWRAELWMAIVGPITSLVIGLLCTMLATGGVSKIDPDNPRQLLASLGPASTLLLWLGQINIVLACFNLVPGFPLDGGRVLRAALWGMTGNLRQATRWASAAGQFFAWLLIISGVAMMLGLRVPVFGSGFVGGLWISFIGWFLHNAALLGYQQLVVKESLGDIPVTRVMQTGFMTVPPDLPVDRLVDDYFLHSPQRGLPVQGSDRLLGMVCLDDVRKLDRKRWPYTTVREIMTPSSALVQVGPQDDMHKALTLLGEGDVSQIPVVENGRVRGLVRREDILKWIALYVSPDAGMTISSSQAG